jgi:uncharacterized membrane protein YkvA (DUF1232 family)
MYMQKAKRKEQWKQKAKKMQSEVLALYLAYKEPGVPWYAKLWVLIVVGYAFSPIDLIPDFIPILGYLDDFVLIPLGVVIAIKMIPQPIMEEARIMAETMVIRPKSQIVAIFIVVIWLMMFVWILYIVKGIIF